MLAAVCTDVFGKLSDPDASGTCPVILEGMGTLERAGNDVVFAGFSDDAETVDKRQKIWYSMIS